MNTDWMGSAVCWYGSLVISPLLLHTSNRKITNAMLLPAGGGAYYFAKRSINADRLTRFDATQKRKDEMAKAEASARAAAEQSKTTISRAGQLNSGSQKDDAYSPSDELGHDPAPTRHEPETDAQRLAEKGKYEAAEVFRSRKGDRFS
ncbi:hypothetical protein MGYG_04199 [Nannizzia gypsea CBS 118893]|uniref:Uncharacterized protein n=1 Tax=Arthroderma gypseum (strain ATCC MYA-4604 / CBS 118893) TaxID=535722 RepID=E4URS5_ARTGP|nr:hypothetical protein MGYG_04199 [Nannizzia gypsea CBS 118893]EFR01197.1 hypothetical protein MGYG_04199 [Nannizzia gypsea CBS 118893]